MRAGDGAPEAVEATVLLAQNAAVLHINVLTIGPPAGAAERVTYGRRACRRHSCHWRASRRMRRLAWH
eukprot:2611377-Pleurochrysis_carterae.AAC.1